LIQHPGFSANYFHRIKSIIGSRKSAKAFFPVKKAMFQVDMTKEIISKRYVMIKRLLKKWFRPHDPMKDIDHNIWVYPSHRSCVKHNMSQVKPEQMPPLMVRKAPWRR